MSRIYNASLQFIQNPHEGTLTMALHYIWADLISEGTLFYLHIHIQYLLFFKIYLTRSFVGPSLIQILCTKEKICVCKSQRTGDTCIICISGATQAFSLKLKDLLTATSKCCIIGQASVSFTHNAAIPDVKVGFMIDLNNSLEIFPGPLGIKILF